MGCWLKFGGWNLEGYYRFSWYWEAGMDGYHGVASVCDDDVKLRGGWIGSFGAFFWIRRFHYGRDMLGGLVVRSLHIGSYCRRGCLAGGG